MDVSAHSQRTEISLSAGPLLAEKQRFLQIWLSGPLCEQRVTASCGQLFSKVWEGPEPQDGQ